MAESRLVDTGGTLSDDGDEVTYEYQVELDAIVESPRLAVETARGLGPHPVPQRRASLGIGDPLFARRFSAVRSKENRRFWNVQVSFLPPDKGEDESHQIENPLDRPPVVTVRYFDHEYVIKKAYNLTELSGGFTRPAGTLGPIVNGAFRRPDEPPMGNERNGVLIVRKNFATLGEIFGLNDDYRRTTNSDAIGISGHTFDAYTLKYLVTETEGPTTEEQFTYYPGMTEIEITDGTDFTIDNVGFEYWSAADNDYVRARDKDGEPTAEPVNLNLDGTLKSPGGILDGPTTIDYRHLAPVEYAAFFS